MRIIGPPSADRQAVFDRLKESSVHTRFLDEMFGPLWAAGEAYGIDPVGIVAQSYKETGGGQFGGRVLPGFFNTCGLKIRQPGILPGTEGDQPLAHAMFANWAVGAEAHVQHLCAYAGQPLRSWLVVDPRYVWVVGRYRLEAFEELGGRWAPSLTYGDELMAIARRLQGS